MKAQAIILDRLASKLAATSISIGGLIRFSCNGVRYTGIVEDVNESTVRIIRQNKISSFNIDKMLPWM